QLNTSAIHPAPKLSDEFEEEDNDELLDLLLLLSLELFFISSICAFALIKPNIRMEQNNIFSIAKFIVLRSNSKTFNKINIQNFKSSYLA
ncbi:MAG: hypothetical protein DRJ10_14530, partial [Bacteroidetes bacterium]